MAFLLSAPHAASPAGEFPIRAVGIGIAILAVLLCWFYSLPNSDSETRESHRSPAPHADDDAGRR